MPSGSVASTRSRASGSATRSPKRQVEAKLHEGRRPAIEANQTPGYDAGFDAETPTRFTHESAIGNEPPAALVERSSPAGPP